MDEAAGFYVRARTSASQIYYTHKNNSDFTSDCTAKAGESITCVVEGEELDLYYNGVTLQHNVPSAMCTYITRLPYYYYKWQTGLGPALVRVDTDSAGNVGEDTNSNGVIDQPTSTCPFDYTGGGGPNCCLGTYSRVVRRWNATNLNYDVISSDPAVVWGGKAGNCLGGAALYNWPLDLNGFPYELFAYIEGSGTNDVYSAQAPITKHRLTNLEVANWFDPADHGGGKPAAVISPYYRYRCLDRAYEVIAEINVLVREWNTRAAFNLRESNPTNHSELGFEDSPFNTLPKNDFGDWKDFGNAFPQGAD